MRLDSLAQLVEHNTFNVGVLGSNPKRVTYDSKQVTYIPNGGHLVTTAESRRNINSKEKY